MEQKCCSRILLGGDKTENRKESLDTNSKQNETQPPIVAQNLEHEIAEAGQ